VSLRGIAPQLLVAQVRGTVPWLLAARPPFTEPLFNVGAAERAWRGEERSLAYLELLLVAHHATVASFVPTDVDARIRHHEWQQLEGKDEIAAAVALVDRIAALPAREVSTRVVADALAGDVSGHDGEWLSVRAGALGRAVLVGATAVAEHVVAAIEAELVREARAFTEAFEDDARSLDALRLATLVAHNTGDLSRVVLAWPKRPELEPLRARFALLGHGNARGPHGALALAGAVNKATIAPEAHRHLPLREARALRRHADLLLPLGPFFDEWGARVATHPGLDEADRAEVVAKLLELAEQRPNAQGALRALAGFHHAHRGGLEALAHLLPARLRKRVATGPVREALGLAREAFEQRWARRLRAIKDELTRR
jgi:hypothetical protein